MNPHHERAQHLLDLKRYREALVECGLAVAAEPQEAFHYDLLGVVLCAAGRQAEALAASAQALALAPNDPSLHYNHAYILYSGGQNAAAEVPLSRALALDPERAAYWALSADLAYRQRDLPRMRAHAERALALEPTHAFALNRLARALLQLNQPAPAEDICRRALALRPQDAAIHNLLGWALFTREDYDGALEHYQIALQLDPGSREPKSGMMECLKRRHPVYGPVLRILTAAHVKWLPTGFVARLFVFGVPGGLLSLCGFRLLHGPHPWLTATLAVAVLVLTLGFIEAEACYVLALGWDRQGRPLVTPLARSVALQQLLGMGTFLLLLGLGWWTGRSGYWILALVGGVGVAITLHAWNCAPGLVRVGAALLVAIAWGGGLLGAWAIRAEYSALFGPTCAAWLAGLVPGLAMCIPWTLVALLVRWFPADEG